MSDFATLVLSADASGLKQGEQALDSLASKGEETEGKLAQSSANLSKEFDRVVASIANVTEAQNRGNTIAAQQVAALRDLVEHTRAMGNAANLAQAPVTGLQVALKETAQEAEKTGRIYQAVNQMFTGNAGTPTGMQAQIEAMTGVTRASDEAARSAVAYGAELDFLRAQFNPLFAVSRRYEKDLRDIAAAERMGAISAAEAARAREMAAQSLAPLNRSVNDGSDGMSNYAHRVSQASFQIQDFAVQVASGQSAMMAFTQQFPQLAGSLGATGKLALYGSLMGTAVAVTAAIVPHLIDAGDAGRSLDDVMGDLADSVDRYADAIEASSAPLDELIEKYGRAAISARALLKEEQELRRVQAMQELNDGAGKIAGEVQGIFGGMTYRSASWTRELAEDLEISVDQMARLLDLNQQLETAQGPQAQATAAADMRDYFLEVYGTVDNIPPRLLDIYDALIDSGKAATQFQSLTEDAGTSVEAVSVSAAAASIEIWSMSDAASGLAGYFNAANTATGGLLGTLQSAAAAAWDLANGRVAAQRTAQQIATQTELDPLGAFTGGQGAAMRVQVGAGGVIRTPTAPTIAPASGGGRRRSGGGRTRSGGGDGRERLNGYERSVADIQSETEAFLRQADAIAQLTAAGGDWERALAVIEEEQKLLNDAQKAGVEITPQVRASITEMAEAWVDAEERLERIRTATEKGQDTMEGFFGSITGGADGVIDALSGILEQIAKVQLAKAGMGLLGATSWGSGAMESLGNLLSMDGGGYTGNGARSGGMDGKGGFLAMLHPQETVIDHTKGQSAGGAVDVRVYMDDDGTWQAQVERISGAVSARTVAQDRLKQANQQYLKGGR
ncbi:hypothetical protein [Paracoccus fontiphilus]|uniref:Prophage tail length tape measure protein n=1 Tax=Paracoccus fontiphilus TaxID=1815556 RepID=A0ABV7IGT9_9RHOB|nr:hypothetical protein [Paracoccus fontiphilus]